MDVYGIDTEFHRERTYFPHLDLIQVAWAGGVALVDPLAVSLAPLAAVLDGPGLAVLHAADQDLEV
ncbi:MAG: ribonuclease D, partial [Acidimicrobiales bacterium]